jgi:hypothetical protein
VQDNTTATGQSQPKPSYEYQEITEKERKNPHLNSSVGEHNILHTCRRNNEKGLFGLVAQDTPVKEKTITFQKAKGSPEWLAWKEAMLKEIKAIKGKDTWKWVSKPKNRQILRLMWVLIKKYFQDGRFDKLKARLVVLGNQQKVDPLQSYRNFAPTLRFVTIRLLLFYATVQDLCVLQFDVKNAFLNSPLHEEVYVLPPPGSKKVFDEYGEEMVLQLLKGLYGLRIAPGISLSSDYPNLWDVLLVLLVDCKLMSFYDSQPFPDTSSLFAPF